MWQVQLKSGLKTQKWVYLRPLCGHDEAFVHGTSLIEATQFLDRLLVSTAEHTVDPVKASDLAVCDGDRLFAALYLNYFGDQIESTLRCLNCHQSFEIQFSLPELMANLDQMTATNVTGPDVQGIYTLTDGRRFRLPTIGDRNNLSRLNPEQAMTMLLQKCVIEGDPHQDSPELEAAMNEVGPLLDLDLDATCPECETAQRVQFDIQTYLLRSLAYEQRFLNREVHAIAKAYGWSYQEILNLTRESRRNFVRLIEADAGLRRRERR